MLSLIDAECWGGPEDGAIVRAERRPLTKFRRFNAAAMAWDESTYALELTEQGTFRLKHLHTMPIDAFA